MYCKNCGTRLNDNAKVCPNCGTFIDDGSGYTLLTADNRLDDFYSSEPVDNKGRGVIAYIISLILVIAIAGGGAYYYFTHIKPKTAPAPEVSFTSGCGIINEDVPVVYASFEKDTSIQYIHGVSLYEYDGKDTSSAKLLSNDYEYTKNIDDTFRAVFFDTTEFKLKKDKTYNYYFEIKLGFIGSSDIFTYTQPVSFKGGFTESAADIVFDHSNSKTSGASQKEEETTEEKTTKKTETGFIYESYWFTRLVTDNDTRTIFAFKFSKDNTYTSTKYEKKGSSDWSVSTHNGKFKIEGEYLVASDSDGGEKSYYKIGNSSLTEELDGESVQNLTPRKYNSVKNAEDFFGL